jgi:hypothetical protein
MYVGGWELATFEYIPRSKLPSTSFQFSPRRDCDTESSLRHSRELR